MINMDNNQYRGDRGELLHGQVVTTFIKIKTKYFKRLDISQSIT